VTNKVHLFNALSLSFVGLCGYDGQVRSSYDVASCCSCESNELEIIRDKEFLLFSSKTTLKRPPSRLDQFEHLIIV
jgi:hypothetical protein